MNELTTTSQNQVAILEGAISIETLLGQRKLVVSAMKEAMTENQHYGKIPGTGEKPTLLQPGAQILCHIFRLRPEYEIFETNLPGDHKAYRVTCRLVLMGSTPPILISEGVGESSSMESKNRYRNSAAEVQDTGDELPKGYWPIKEGQGSEAANKWLGNAYEGAKVGPKKIDGTWKVVKFIGGGEGKIENPNPADTHNTVLKIAKKRAFVDATITATAASDLFTQDLEDIRENLAAVDSAAPVTQGAPQKAAEPKKGTATAKATPGGKAGDAGTEIGDWREVCVHWGKEGGKIKGKKLSELSESQREWLVKHYAEKPADARLSADDKCLIAALNMAKGGAAAETKKPDAGGAKVGNEGDIRSANLAVISENLDFAGVTTERFLTVCRAEKWIVGETFESITGEEARDLLEGIDNVIDRCKAEAK